ncbi:MAG TPA: septum formation initiator family protein [Candidatus Saccharimonadia bacterium]|nr:septum formation initiator family protein [Candidatus Saccharimonadia bacterium]
MTLPKIKLGGTNVLNLIGVLVILYLVVVLVQTVQHNYRLGRQIDQLNAQISLLQSQKDELAYRIQYYNTDAFRDREARAKLGLQAPGENVVIIPRSSPAPAAAAGSAKAAPKKSNLQQWFDFLSGRT